MAQRHLISNKLESYYTPSLTSATFEAINVQNDVEMAEEQGNPFALCASSNFNPFKCGTDQTFLSVLITGNKTCLRDENGYKIIQKKFLQKSYTDDGGGGGFKPGQMLAFNSNLYKVHHSLIAEYLECDEIYRLTRTCRKLYSYLQTDKFFNKITIDSFDEFFTHQFTKAFENKPCDTAKDLLMTSVDLTSISTKKFTAKDT